ncbi:MAG: hypothetical protein IKA12_02020 [Clostridia bacterium]|nr:hypothetical protein [Clostridia bacterium]
MDKFGVFNLLSSLLSKSQQENSSSTNIVTPDDTQNTKQPPKHLDPPLPLQASMINTMTSHDEFIKRVKQKNKK